MLQFVIRQASEREALQPSVKNDLKRCFWGDMIYHPLSANATLPQQLEFEDIKL